MPYHAMSCTVYNIVIAYLKMTTKQPMNDGGPSPRNIRFNRRTRIIIIIMILSK